MKLGLIWKLLMPPMIFEMLGVGVGYKKQMGTVHLFEFEVICSICRLWKNLVDGNCRQYSFLLNIFTRECGYKLMRVKASCIPMPWPLSAYLAVSCDHKNSTWIHKVRLLLGYKWSLLEEFEMVHSYDYIFLGVLFFFVGD